MKVTGSYCLCIGIKDKTRITVGALGKIAFPAGCYIYVGSALNGLEHRITRHMDMSHGVYKAVHWHIDYLLKAPEVEIRAVYYKESKDREECSISEGIAERGKPVPCFGSSDCRCTSHLYKVDGCDFLNSLGLSKVNLDDDTVFHGNHRWLSEVNSNY
ncbi:MAG: GIY-YIG nuclease family protein [Candidatus Bathyarchaeia archaeon]